MKQETLEEAAEIWINNRFTKQICGDESYPDIYASKESIVESHVIFAKWQAERMYSEEDLKSAFFNGGNMKDIEEFNHWFKQFKKKSFNFEKNNNLK